MIDKYDFIIEYIFLRANTIKEGTTNGGYKLATEAIHAWKAVEEEQQKDSEKSTDEEQLNLTELGKREKINDKKRRTINRN